ncbi:hypothetical protein HRR83_000079 [Exophiala dermatitidis]|uniref:Uncharacterized protein n=2 Tax=Exophiala dermatitidis TaxID=5970 RepID=H6C893_EXODN|nr:uncharacterized protein HMPREF1120_08286 [Exophiala dermatitidis NIH/UT8656]KAJ4523432.1 hypothetical protein HRR73_002613 [Exophiala dermatitidis]EHY60320.1 hypothetical protein HMPREF1120_08286 [Exophiala dermatitidis NIH/UT8656]KAJ4527328.1 hypothetical protein HRR74_000080 [Exophiala dermatitidis]KAJ4530884.1 hypothetical protein HRR76_008575 [Exophiala dermatitidis]KAJ4558057.1 hypothetical protein HRR77_000080 [Exophiala dermatitidis]
MSRRLVGWALVIGFGVLNGYVTFQPALEQRALDKLKEEELAAADLGPNLVEIPPQTTNRPRIKADQRDAQQTG